MWQLGSQETSVIFPECMCSEKCCTTGKTFVFRSVSKTFPCNLGFSNDYLVNKVVMKLVGSQMLLCWQKVYKIQSSCEDLPICFDKENLLKISESAF